MVPGKETTIQDTKEIYNGIVAQRDANRDYDDADTSRQNDTSEGMHGNDHAGDQATGAMETKESCHPRTYGADVGGKQAQTEKIC